MVRVVCNQNFDSSLEVVFLGYSELNTDICVTCYSGITLDSKSYFPTLTVGYLTLKGIGICQGNGSCIKKMLNWELGLATDLNVAPSGEWYILKECIFNLI